ncbi:hypothetical protein MKX07_004961 [Trichoderma sp. CBMAI-0711]|uniref:Uncharacterized protein n=1 Tax=Trichoderma parareesei TaxID=858221 RepID=A0A2H2ZNR9_TRIPA|nr:hypothetical protein MKX07_004961 [Trichoderma sp. CBMAI-0711]OTA06352.1 hypothetical protein A9Z42_0070960 [Trichoderma parareesei]
MSAPKTPPAIIWLKVFVRANLHRVSRKLRGDEPSAAHGADNELPLGPPPPAYERKHKSPHAEGEIATLQQELRLYEARLEVLPEDSPEGRMLLKDAEMLDRWIGHLEYLHAERVGRTVPARFRREPYRDRLKRRIKNRGRAAEPAPRVVVGIMW